MCLCEWGSFQGTEDIFFNQTNVHRTKQLRDQTNDNLKEMNYIVVLVMERWFLALLRALFLEWDSQCYTRMGPAILGQTTIFCGRVWVASVNPNEHQKRRTQHHAEQPSKLTIWL